MREILFRGKRVCDNEWIYGDLVQYLGYGKVRIIPNYTGAGAEDAIPETVGQYTGLKDKNGTQIFEGDLVKCKHEIRLYDFNIEAKDKKPRRSYGHTLEYSQYDTEKENDPVALKYFRNYQVTYDDGHPIFKNAQERGKANSNYVYYHDIEVIGNIYDNPELLKGEENDRKGNA